MKEETPEPPQQSPQAISKEWLYHFEQCARQRAYDVAYKMFHKHFVYFGLQTNQIMEDLLELCSNSLAFSFDMEATRIIAEGNLMLVETTWIGRGLVHGSEPKIGRGTFALMRFTGEKILCVHAHLSKRP